MASSHPPVNRRPFDVNLAMRSRFLRTLLVAAAAAWSAKAFAAEFDLQTASIADLNAAFDAGALSSEILVQLSLARIAAYEPTLHAVITLHPRAIDEARSLDLERKQKGPRSPLHGIPVLLKDNIDTADLPTTAGFYGLKGSLPPRDATVVERLRSAGAIVLAKMNLSEFASGNAMSSLGGQTHNPHDLTITPSGSSGGTAVGVAAGYAPIGLGSDTGGSIRAPASVDGVVGLRPTYGLVSCAGVIPLAPSCDVVGPMTRSVYDLAVVLDVLAGPDARDPATAQISPRAPIGYASKLEVGALRGARIGVARAFFGQEPEVDRVMEAALSKMKAAGAELVDVTFPDWVMKSKDDIYNAVRRSEFRPAVEAYLQTTKPGFPKTHAEILSIAEKIVAAPPEGILPNPSRLELYRQEAAAVPLSDPVYLAARNEGMALMRATVSAIFARHRLDAFVYPTVPKRPAKIPGRAEVPAIKEAKAEGSGKVKTPTPTISGTHLASLTGFPDLILPAGFTSDNLPVGLSFVGQPLSEPRLLSIGFAFEHAVRAWRSPVTTPRLTGERIQF